MATTALISDLHLGNAAGADLLGNTEMIERLLEATADCDRLILLGDVIELRDLPMAEAFELSRPFFERLGEGFADREVVFVPGNHDHRLLGAWIEHRIAESASRFGLSEAVSDPNPVVEMIREWLGAARLELRYPGVWIRDDVYATHGHYLDSHLTLPTFERLSVAVVDRLGGRPTGRRASPNDYEARHAPVYDLLFDLAQGARRRHEAAGRSASMRVWELMGGASGQVRTLRGRVLRSAVMPATLRGLEGFGFGRFSRDFSVAEIGRAGVEAMHQVVASLGIEAEHVVFGHIHRGGPLEDEDGSLATHPGWRRGTVRLHNTGSWQYVATMSADSSRGDPFWPGRVVLVDESGPPRGVELLSDLSGAEILTLLEQRRR